MPTVEENAESEARRVLGVYKDELPPALYESIISDVYIALAKAYVAGTRHAAFYEAGKEPDRIAPLPVAANRAQRRAHERQQRKK
jgi:hypothetical protein